MRLKPILIFVLCVAGALAAIYWKVDHDFFTEKIQWNEAQSRGQLSALTRSIESELEGLTQILDLAYPSLRDSKRDYGTDQVYSRFQMIARLSSQNGDITLDQKYFLQGSPAKSWGPTYAQAALAGLKPADLKTNQLLFVQDPAHKPWLVFVTTSLVTQNQYLAIVDADLLQGIVDRQKGQMSTVAILNQQGFVLAHTISEYIGSSLKEDPLVQDFIRSGNASGSGLFNGIQGERVHGFYEQVNASNAFVTISTPLRLLMAERTKIKVRFLFMGLGICFLGIAGLLLLDGSSQGEGVVHRPIIIKAASEAPAVPMPTGVAAKAATVKTPPAPATPVPPIPVPAVKTEMDEKYESLFNETKINETFAMIDTLDAAAAPPAAPVPKVAKISTPSAKPAAAPMAAPKAPSEIDLEISNKPIKIRWQQKVSALDALDVPIRKPNQRPVNPGDAS